MVESLDDINLVPEPTANRLEPRQQVRYRQYRKRLRDWLHSVGKNPSKAQGYALSTVRTRMTRIDKFLRWIWTHKTDGFTLQIQVAHADAYMTWLAQDKYADDPDDQYARSYKADIQKAVKTLFRFEDTDWEPDITFTDPARPTVGKSVLSMDEWRRVREAAAEYEARIDYHNVTPEERAAVNEVLADRLGKPVEAVGPEDWRDAPSYKFTSMFWLGMDCGLRPAEIGRMRVQWLDLSNCMVHIPAEHATKNEEDWDVPILEETADYLRLWFEERDCFKKYADSNRVWLTKYGNPYQSRSVNHHWQKIRDAAGIDTDGRNLPYYSLRHTQGTNVGEQIGAAGAAGQLRQKDKRSADKYLHARKERQRDALESTR